MSCDDFPLSRQEMRPRMRKKVINRLIILANLFVVMTVFAGCKKEEQPASSPPPQPAKKPVVQKQATSAQVAGTGEQPLDFGGKKDPFKPFAAEPAPQQKARPSVVARSGEILPIQSYDVNKFTLSGIIVGFKENTALVVDPTGKGYVVKEGMLIGNYDGRISRITPSRLEVVEHYRDDNGRVKKRTIALTLVKKK